MRFGVLGPLAVWDDTGASLDVGGRQPRAVVAALVAARGNPLAAEALADVVWGDDPPVSAINTIHSYISRLRRVFAGSDTVQLASDDAGYRLVVDADLVDVCRFERLVADGRSQVSSGDIEAARRSFATALGLWRGDALPELADHDPSIGEIARLDELRMATLDARLDADLALGRHSGIVAELTTIVAEHPFHEPFAAKLALALYRADRQVDALRVINSTAERLRDELGLSPGRQLLELETAMLNQDSGLDAPRGTATATTVPFDSPVDASPSTLVGRHDEIGRLRRAHGAAAIDGRFVVIEGDPGIGKTRLALELEQHALASGSTCVWGRSDESGTAPALWPWLSVLRQLTSAMPGRSQEVIALMEGDVPVVGGRGAAIRYECFDAVANLLESAGDPTPVLVVLDDLQWADETSLELLQFLARRSLRGVCVVSTLRRLEIGQNDLVTATLSILARRPGAEHLVLGGLARDEILALAHMVAPEVDPATIPDELQDKAGGNPFYAIELARLLDHSGDITGGIPATIRDTVRRRLADLPDATLRLLELAATAGRDFTMTLLASAASDTIATCATHLEPALTHRILVSAGTSSPDTLAFSHALVREVLLDGMSDLRRAGLHLEIADALEALAHGPDIAEQLAEHLWRSTLIGGAERAADALDAAAEVAISRVAYPTAEGMLRRSAALRRSSGGSPARDRAELTTLMRLLEVMQSTRYFSGTDRDVLTRAEELAERAGLPDVVRTLQWYGWSSLATAADINRRDGSSERFFERWIQDPRPETRALAHAVRGVAVWSDGRVRDSIDSFDAALDLVAAAPPPEDAFEMESRLVMSTFSLWTHAAHGDRTATEVFDGFRGLLDTWPAAAAPSICGFACTIAATLDCWDDLSDFVDRATRADPAAQFAFWGGQSLMYQGMLAARAGDVDDGLARFGEGRHRYRSVGARSGLSSFEAVMGEIAMECGRRTAGSELVATARRRLTATEERWNESIVCTAEAAVARHAGSERRVSERLETASRVAIEQGAMSFAHRVARRARELDAPMPPV